jgi:hypothetical protein
VNRHQYEKLIEAKPRPWIDPINEPPKRRNVRHWNTIAILGFVAVAVIIIYCAPIIFAWVLAWFNR